MDTFEIFFEVFLATCYIILISVPDKPGQVNGLHSADQLCFSACDDGGNVLPHRCGGDRDGARG